MADVKWIKITTDIFDDEKMLLIESLPAADSIITIWFKLLTLAGKQNNSGVFLMNDRIAYTDEMLATIFRRDVNTVRLALSTFEDFGMVEVIDGVITIPKWEKHQTLDAYEQKKERDRIYQAERRKKQKLLATKSSDKSSDIEKNRLVEEDIEEDKEIEVDKNKKKIDYSYIVDRFNLICTSLPKVTILTEKRKKAMDKVFIKDSVIRIEDLDILLAKINDSDFLTGRNGTWKANFDWVMNPTNIAKVIDGNYDNHQANGKPTYKSGNVFLDIAKEENLI